MCEPIKLTRYFTQIPLPKKAMFKDVSPHRSSSDWLKPSGQAFALSNPKPSNQRDVCQLCEKPKINSKQNKAMLQDLVNSERYMIIRHAKSGNRVLEGWYSSTYLANAVPVSLTIPWHLPRENELQHNQWIDSKDKKRFLHITGNWLSWTLRMMFITYSARMVWLCTW